MLDNEPSGGTETGTQPVTGAPADTDIVTRRTRAPRKRAATAEPRESTEPTELGESVEPLAIDPIVPFGSFPAADLDSDLESATEAESEFASAAPWPQGGLSATVLFMPPEPVAAPVVAPLAPTMFLAVEAPAATPFTAPEPARVAPAVRVAPDVAEEPEAPASRRRRARRSTGAVEQVTEGETPDDPVAEDAAIEDGADDADDELRRSRRRRGRRGRGRGKGGADDFEDSDLDDTDAEESTDADEPIEASEDAEDFGSVRRRRRTPPRRGAGDAEVSDDPNVVVKIREPRTAVDEVQGVSGSTRLEAKRQRRRDGREQRRTRPSILTEAEFLARREAVDRVMVVRQLGDRTQTAVLEDGVLVEHYVARASQSTMVGNVYLGRVQNVLPSMEAAFVDIGRGRNAVLYAGEVNWESVGLSGRGRSIEQALKPGDSVLVQVTKDPVGHKGARLTSHIALSGRHLVYVPKGNASGISRKLSDTERKRLRDILKHLVPDEAGVIVRTAAEGATVEDLERDVTRLRAQWEAIEVKAKSGSAPVALYEEPDLVIRVVRDLFNEDFRELVIQGEDAWDQVEPYLTHVSPDLVGRLRRYAGAVDAFQTYRIDEQIMKALDRKVFLPSGGSLVIDRTEAMTVVDVNTGKFIGHGGNLEETVTKNNLEAAEEIVRQLRLRDLGGIIVIDFIDMVLESNRELVLRRLTECLGRDRTKHQVTEITSLGLVQMTRKRMGQGLLEAFSETCECCKGRGVIIHPEPVMDSPGGSVPARNGSTGNGGSAGNGSSGNGDSSANENRDKGRKSRRRRGRDESPGEAESPSVVSADVTESEPGRSEPAVAVAVAAVTVGADDVSGTVGQREPEVPAAPPAPQVPIVVRASEDDPDAAVDGEDAEGGRRRSRRGSQRRRGK